jgi:hypothetical protein
MIGGQPSGSLTDIGGPSSQSEGVTDSSTSEEDDGR